MMLKKSVLLILIFVLVSVAGCALPLPFKKTTDTTSIPPLEDVIANVSRAVVRVITSTASGTGMVIDEAGYILTNEHVISGYSSVTVVFSDGSQVKGSVLGYDANIDLAVIKVINSGLTAVHFGDSNTAKAGQEVVALGYPLDLTGSVTVTKGIVSAIQSDGIQTDVAVNAGNSGGPLINRNGDVIGIMYMRYVGSSSAPIEGIGFAIPINTAISIIPTLKQGYSNTTSQTTYAISPTTVPNVTVKVPTTVYSPPVTIIVPSTTVTQTTTHTVTAIATTTLPPTTVYPPPTTVYYTRTQVVPSITTTPYSGTPDTIIFSFSGTNNMTLPNFVINSTCRLVYTADWTGTFYTYLSNASVLDTHVTAGQSYETYLNGFKGSYAFQVFGVPNDGHWTLTVYPA